jgi:hypothetical protein
MKLKALLTAVLVAGIAASFAVASPPPGKGRERPRDAATSTSTTERAPKRGRSGEARGDRRPVVTLMLKGTFVSASADSFAMLVKNSNKHARSLRGKQVTVKVDDKTKFRRRGKAELSDLVEGDRLHVLVRARKNAESSSLELLARMVKAQPAKTERDDDDEDDEDEGETTGTTATTATNTGTTASSD